MEVTKRILIVEDEESVLRILSDTFKDEGFEVYEASDGRLGLEVAEAKRPSIILLDVIMPKMDGMTMLKELRQTDWGRTIPVILLTNLSEYEKVAQAMEAKVFDYLVKSDWKIKDVVEVVKRKLGLES